MDSWVVSQLSFWYTVYEVKPSLIVDKIISFWVDLWTPGRGAGESTWWMQGIRSIEQQTERTSRELDIRSQLRQWDRDYPQIHHELIVRYICGAIISVGCTSFYNAIKRANQGGSYDPYHRR